MFKVHVLIQILFIIGVTLAPEASAHKPSYAENNSSMETAFEVEDPDVSIALYAEMTCEADTLWLHLRTDDVSEVWVELGVPQLDRLEEYSPSLAFLAAGLPNDDNESLPFDVPEGMGSMVIDTYDVETPIDFYEPFTQTESWILFREWIALPENTDVYIVAYDPDDYTGKIWVAVGLTEDFSDVEPYEYAEWLNKTQSFHEVGDTDERVETDCSSISGNLEEDAGSENPECGGCSAVGNRTTSLPLLIVMMGMVVGVRRRRPSKS